jgi:hypothetical protein
MLVHYLPKGPCRRTEHPRPTHHAPSCPRSPADHTSPADARERPARIARPSAHDAAALARTSPAPARTKRSPHATRNRPPQQPPASWPRPACPGTRCVERYPHAGPSSLDARHARPCNAPDHPAQRSRITRHRKADHPHGEAHHPARKSRIARRGKPQPARGSRSPHGEAAARTGKPQPARGSRITLHRKADRPHGKPHHRTEKRSAARRRGRSLDT